MALKKIVGFIGGGQMAEAMIKGLLSSQTIEACKIYVSEPIQERRNYLVQAYEVKVFERNSALVKEADIIILAVKPQVLSEVLAEISPAIEVKRHLVISIAAGISLAFLERRLPEGTRVIRVMPNTPALVLAGISAYTPGKKATKEDLDVAKEILSALGECLQLPETFFDAVTGLSGSGPAFVAIFLEALIDGGVKVGLPRPIAERLALQTVVGTIRLMKESGRDPYQIKAMVTSPGGTTIAGVKALARGAFSATVMDAIEAATKRSEELSRLIA